MEDSRAFTVYLRPNEIDKQIRKSFGLSSDMRDYRSFLRNTPRTVLLKGLTTFQQTSGLGQRRAN